MQREYSSDSVSSDQGPPEAIPNCVVCEKAAVGRGPFAERYLCSEHLNVDVAHALELKEQVDEKLWAYSQAKVAGCSAAGGVGDWIRKMEEQLRRTEQKFEAMRRDLDSCEALLTGLMRARIETARVWQRDIDDVRSYTQESEMADAAGDMSKLVELTMSMELSLEDLKTDFDRLQKSMEESLGAEQQLDRLAQLTEQFGRALARVNTTVGWKDAEVSATPEEIDDAVKHLRQRLFDPIVFSHEVKLDGRARWLTVCSDTKGFAGDRSGRVVAAESASDDGNALPQPCIFASFDSKDHLQVLSVDGSKKLRCHCDIDWKKDIWGLYCDRQLLYIAQDDAVTVTDLSGRKVRRMESQLERFVRGIGGNAASVFVSGGNNIVAFSKATGEMETVITLSEPHNAELGNMAIHDNCILVTDRKHNQVHRVRIDTQQVVASYPSQRCGLKKFAGPQGVAVDLRGRLFVSECGGQSVRAVAADGGSLLWTLGVPGKSGSGDGKLCCPLGLVVVTEGQREKLVVADGGNRQLVVLNVD